MNRDELTTAALLTACRESLLPFCHAMGGEQYKPAPFHRDLCGWLDRVRSGDVAKLMISTPPQHGKSHHLTHLLAYWIGSRPDARCAYITYGFDLAKSFSRQVRAILESDLFQAIFPECRLAPGAASTESMRTTKNGELLFLGVGSSVTGRGISENGIAIIDDPVADRQAANSRAQMEALHGWFDSVYTTRLHPKAAQVLCGTRWSVNDLHGHALKSDPDGWAIKTWPALDEDGNSLWPDRYPVEALAKIKDTVDSYTWRCLYLCEAHVQSEHSIPPESWQFIKPENIPTHGRGGYPIRYAWGIDLAVSTKASADHSAMVRVGTNGTDWYIGPGWYAKLPWPKCKEKIKNTIQAHKPDSWPVHVESVAGFMAAVQDLQQEVAGSARVVAQNVSTDKMSRAWPWLSLLDAGRLYLLDIPAFKPFASELVYQAEHFGAASVHDDGIDAVSIAYAALSKRQSGIAYIR